MGHPPRQTLALDTTPEAEDQQIALWRGMTTVEKMALFFDLHESMLRMAEAGIRMRHPQANEREVFLRRAALTFDRATMIAVYGWDPDAHP